MDIDWHGHFSEGGRGLLTEEKLLERKEASRPYIELLQKHLKPGARILECGCGPARTAVVMSLAGFRVTAIDKDERMLQLARKNAAFGKGMEFLKLDLFDIDSKFSEASFDCCTHQGVLEHFAEEEAKDALRRQMKVAGTAIFTVPISGGENVSETVHGSIFRNMWTGDYWINHILGEFDVPEHLAVTMAVVRPKSENSAHGRKAPRNVTK